MFVCLFLLVIHWQSLVLRWCAGIIVWRWTGTRKKKSYSYYYSKNQTFFNDKFVLDHYRSYSEAGGAIGGFWYRGGPPFQCLFNKIKIIHFFLLRSNQKFKKNVHTLEPCHCILLHAIHCHYGVHDVVNQILRNSQHDDLVKIHVDHVFAAYSLVHCLNDWKQICILDGK